MKFIALGLELEWPQNFGTHRYTPEKRKTNARDEEARHFPKAGKSH